MSPTKKHTLESTLDDALNKLLDKIGCPSDPSFRHRVQTLLLLCHLCPSVTHPKPIAEAVAPWQQCANLLWRQTYQGRLLQDWCHFTLEKITPCDAQSMSQQSILLMLARYYERGLAKNDRKKSGQFHTPIPLANALIEHALQTLSTETNSKKTTQKEVSESPQILDPACGTGAFLWAAHQQWLKAKPFMVPRFFGLDQDPVSLAIASALLEGHYYPVDSLSLYPDFQQASIQQTPVLKGQMDWVIGNPPYVGEKNNKALFQQLLASNPAWKEHYQGKMDYWYFFLYLGLAALKPGGHLLFLTSRYWLTANGAKKLRESILDQAEIIEIIDFEESGWFSDAVGHHSGAFLLKKNESLEDGLKTHRPIWSLALAQSESLQFESKRCPPQSKWHSDPWSAPMLPEWDPIFETMQGQKTPLHTVFWDMQGIISGADHLTQSHLDKYPTLEQAGHQLGEGIFCVSPTTHPELFASKSVQPYLKRYFKGRHIQIQTFSSATGQTVIQFPEEEYLIYLPHHLETPPPDIILHHLTPFRSILEARREVQQGKIPWYALHWPRNEQRLKGVSLVTPRRSVNNRFALSPEGWFAHSDLTLLGLKETPNEPKCPYWPWLLLLNSPLINAWMTLKGKPKGKIREYYATPLRQIPLPNTSKMLALPDPSTALSEKKIHQWVCQCYDLSDDEAQFVWDHWQEEHVKKA